MRAPGAAAHRPHCRLGACRARASHRLLPERPPVQQMGQLRREQLHRHPPFLRASARAPGTSAGSPVSGRRRRESDGPRPARPIPRPPPARRWSAPEARRSPRPRRCRLLDRPRRTARERQPPTAAGRSSSTTRRTAPRSPAAPAGAGAAATARSTRRAGRRAAPADVRGASPPRPGTAASSSIRSRAAGEHSASTSTVGSRRQLTRDATGDDVRLVELRRSAAQQRPCARARAPRCRASRCSCMYSTNLWCAWPAAPCTTTRDGERSSSSVSRCSGDPVPLRMPVDDVRQQRRHRRVRLPVEAVKRPSDAGRELLERSRSGRRCGLATAAARACAHPAGTGRRGGGPGRLLVEVEQQDVLAEAAGFLVLEVGETLLSGPAGRAVPPGHNADVHLAERRHRAGTARGAAGCRRRTTPCRPPRSRCAGWRRSRPLERRPGRVQRTRRRRGHDDVVHWQPDDRAAGRTTRQSTWHLPTPTDGPAGPGDTSASLPQRHRLGDRR